MRYNQDIMYKNHRSPDFSWSNHRHRNCCCRPTLFRHVARVVVYRRVDCRKGSAVAVRESILLPVLIRLRAACAH